MPHAVIGTGNLAWHLGRVLPDETLIVSRHPETVSGWPRSIVPAEELAHRAVGIVFLAVPDRAIGPVSNQLAALLPPTTPVVHTSGATPIAAISDYFLNRGVLWPIRSLRSGEAVSDWRDLPLVIYANNPDFRRQLTTLATALSGTVRFLDDRQRAQLHLAAVFSNNFVTALYEIAYRLCADQRVPFDLLLPIIRHTAAQQSAAPPRDRQTGAAVRGDTATMERHLSLIDRPEYAELYRSISALILEYRLPEHHTDLGRQPDDDLQN